MQEKWAQRLSLVSLEVVTNHGYYFSSRKGYNARRVRKDRKGLK